jgi:hypothetical protein
LIAAVENDAASPHFAAREGVHMRLVALALTLQPLPTVVFVTERGEIEIEVDTERGAA